MKPLKNLLPVLVTLLIALGAGYGMWQLGGAPATVKDGASVQTGEVTIGGPFALIDQNGKPVTDADFRGKLMLVYFGFTYCPDICPTDLSVMSRAMGMLGDAPGKAIVPVFITIDPERDTPAQLKSILSNFHPAIVGLTGERPAIDAAVKAYRVYAQKVQREDLNDYTMDHSAFMYLMDGQGRYLTHFRHNTEPSEIVTTIRKYL